MKNIHILKTNPQHIYITSDEEIKEGDWCLCGGISLLKVIKEITYDSVKTANKDFETKKIILTTDQDLIKDGVQAIDDEFLKWFTKNPSCEEVMVDKFISEIYFCTNPMIPKEEPKQICDNCKIEISKYGCGCGKQEEPKPVWKQIIETCGGEEEFMKSAGLLSQQGTLEEAAKRYAAEYGDGYDDKSFIAGANWQAKRNYTQQQVREIFSAWFQFKYQAHTVEKRKINSQLLFEEFWDKLLKTTFHKEN